MTSSESSLIETQPYSITFTSNLASLFPYSLTLCNPNLASAKKNTMEHNRLLVRYLDSWLPWTVFRMVESSRFLLDRASFTSTSHVNRMSGPPLEKGTTMVFVCPALAAGRLLSQGEISDWQPKEGGASKRQCRNELL